MNTELDISRIIISDDFVPFDLCNNRATLGDDAARLTWQASVETAREIAPPLLDCEAKREAFRDFVRDSGGWTRDEIAAWSDEELNALLLQWIAGDIREAFSDADPSEWDWAEYQNDAEQGRIAGRIFRADDGRVFFSISN